jgi:tripartite-type tricarboxylate transporter receptor subunit TctC
MNNKKIDRRAVLTLAAGALAATSANADQYPTRSIRIIVPFGPGGSGDITARMIGKVIEDKTSRLSSSTTVPVPTASSAPWRSRPPSPTATPCC